MTPYSRIPLDAVLQVKHLQDKGMVVKDVAQAEAYLRRVSLYRFKGYAHHFKDVSTRKYVQADFDRIRRLIQLDDTLRLHVLNGFQFLEVALRTHISEHLTLTYGMHWYQMATVFPGRATDAATLSSMLSQEFRRSKEDFAIHFKRAYPGAVLPAWVATELFTFAVWSKIYEALSLTDKQGIAAGLRVSHEDLEDALKALTVLRNKAAHHARLWNIRVRPMRLPGAQGSALRARMLATSLIPTGAEYTLATRLYAMQLLLQSIGERTWGQNLRLINRFEPYGLHNMGFRPNWEQQPEWS